MKRASGDVIILHMCTKYHDHMIRNGSSFLNQGRGDLIQNFSWQILENYSKESSFLQYQKFLNFQRFYVLPLSSYNYKNLSVNKTVYKNLFFIKKNYFINTFLGGFFLKPKLNKSFLCFRFDIYFKIIQFSHLDLSVKFAFRKA